MNEQVQRVPRKLMEIVMSNGDCCSICHKEFVDEKVYGGTTDVGTVELVGECCVHRRHWCSGGHRYNRPNITAKEFLFEVMRDASVPIADRVRAASALMGIEPDGPNHNHSDASMNQSAAVH
jgi:hypothetical protein